MVHLLYGLSDLRKADHAYDIDTRVDVFPAYGVQYACDEEHTCPNLAQCNTPQAYGIRESEEVHWACEDHEAPHAELAYETASRGRVWPDADVEAHAESWRGNAATGIVVDVCNGNACRGLSVPESTAATPSGPRGLRSYV